MMYELREVWKVAAEIAGSQEAGEDLLYRRESLLHSKYTSNYESAVRDPTGNACRLFARWCRIFGKKWLEANPPLQLSPQVIRNWHQ